MAVMTIKTGMWDDFFGCTLALTEEYDKLESYHDLRTSELPQKPLQNLISCSHRDNTAKNQAQILIMQNAKL